MALSPRNKKIQQLLLSKPHREWSRKEVLLWLELIGLHQYKDSFANNGITGAYLDDIDRDDIETFGIQKVGHKVRLRSRLQLLQKNDPSAFEPVE